MLLLDALNLGVQRYVLGVMMVIYGLPKVVGGFFDYELFALDMPMSEASEFQLSWYFYGKILGRNCSLD